MGLDMYLSRKTYVKNWDHNPPSERYVITVAHEDGSPVVGLDLAKVSYIEEEVGYWRKANQIHAWFVANVQDGKDDCGTYYVSGEQLQKLLDACKKVLKASKLAAGKVANGYTFENGQKKAILEDGKVIVDASVAEELLPTTSGFFFGGTDYDEYYLDDVKQTIEILKPLLADKGGEIYYHSSW